MPSVELRSKTPLTTLTGTEFVYVQKQATPYTVSSVPMNLITNHAYTILAKRNATNPNYQLDIVVNGTTYLMDITTVGALGRDSATAEAISTWYYIYEITKADNTKSVIFSTSSTTPTLPTGYIYYKLISMVRNNSSGNFVDFVQENDEWGYVADTTIKTGAAFYNETLDCRQWIPEAVKKAFVRVLVSALDSATNAGCYCQLYSYLNGVYFLKSDSPATGVTTTLTSRTVLNTEIGVSSRYIKWVTFDLVSATTALSTLSISGFNVPL